MVALLPLINGNWPRFSSQGHGHHAQREAASESERSMHDRINPGWPVQGILTTLRRPTQGDHVDGLPPSYRPD